MSLSQRLSHDDGQPGRTALGVPLTGAEELAIVTRAGFVESRHLGHAVVLARTGEVVVSVGDPDALVNPRSSLKPLQAATCLLSGAPLSGAALSIGAGSHVGHPDHVDLVTTVLAEVGLGLDALQTPPALPSQDWSRNDLLRAGAGPDAVHHNCSGKHAAMLAACVAAGWDTSSYLDPEHPLQRHTRDLVEHVTGVAVAHVGIDGCGAPLFTTTPIGLARALGRVGQQAGRHPRPAAASSWPPGDTAVDDALGAVGRAMRDHPWAVAGIGAEDTVVMQELDGVVAKGGAEGVMALGTAAGAAVVVKVLDGASRAAMPAALALLAATGIETAALTAAVATRTLGHGEPVGRVHPGELVRDRVAAVGRSG